MENSGFHFRAFYKWSCFSYIIFLSQYPSTHKWKLKNVFAQWYTAGKCDENLGCVSSNRWVLITNTLRKEELIKKNKESFKDQKNQSTTGVCLEYFHGKVRVYLHFVIKASSCICVWYSISGTIQSVRSPLGMGTAMSVAGKGPWICIHCISHLWFNSWHSSSTE